MPPDLSILVNICSTKNLLSLIASSFNELYSHCRYFCKEGAASSTPTQGDLEADVCPPGHYCPTGTSQPEKCPLGTFSNTTLLTAAGECLNCTGGESCYVSPDWLINYFPDSLLDAE